MKKHTLRACFLALVFCFPFSARADVNELAHKRVTDVQGKTKVFVTGDGGYDFLIYEPEKVGDSISFAITIPEAGNYRMQTTTYKTGDEGIYQWEIDGKAVNKFDFYESNVWEHGTFYANIGTYTITYRCIGKNPKSPGIGVYLGNLDIEPAN